MKMRGVLFSLVCLSLFPSSGLAVFAAHQVLTPDNAAREGMTLGMTAMAGEDLITVEVQFGQKAPHLVVARKAGIPSPSGFRPVLGSVRTDDSISVDLVALLARQPPRFLSPEAPETKIVTFKVSPEQLMRSYLCFDFPDPSMVLDGGTYYTVDLPAFYREFLTSPLFNGMRFYRSTVAEG